MVRRRIGRVLATLFAACVIGAITWYVVESQRPRPRLVDSREIHRLEASEAVADYFDYYFDQYSSLLTCAGNGCTRTWDLTTMRVIDETRGVGESLFSPDGLFVAKVSGMSFVPTGGSSPRDSSVGDGRGFVMRDSVGALRLSTCEYRISEMASGKELGSANDLSRDSFSSNSQWLSWIEGRDYVLMELGTGGKIRGRLPDCCAGAQCLKPSPDGSWLVAGLGGDRQHPDYAHCVFSVRRGVKTHMNIQNAYAYICDLSFSPDSRWLVVDHMKEGEPGLSLWDLRLSREVRLPHRWSGESLCFSPYSHYLVFWSREARAHPATGSYVVWDLRLQRIAAEQTHHLEEDTAQCRPQCAFSPNGKLLALREPSGPVHVLDTATWREMRFVDAESGDDPSHKRNRAARHDLALAFSPDSRWLAVGNVNGGVSLADIAVVKSWWVLPRFGSEVRFSPDSEWISARCIPTPHNFQFMTGGSDPEGRTLLLWRIEELDSRTADR